MCSQKKFVFQTGKLHVAEPTGIKFPDIKSSGVSLRSARIKLPGSIGQKKVKGIEQTLIDLKIGKTNFFLKFSSSFLITCDEVNIFNYRFSSSPNRANMSAIQ